MFKFFVLVLFLASCASDKNKIFTYDGHGSDSLSKEVLKKFAPRSLPSDKLRKIQSYLDIKSPSLGLLSPDGKKYFFNWNVTGSKQIWMINGALSYPIQMTGGEDQAKLRSITPDGKYLIVTRDLKGDEYPGLYLQSTNGGPLITVFKKKKTKVYPSTVTNDSRFIYYRSNDRHKKGQTFYKWNLKTQKREIIFDRKVGYWAMSDYLEGGIHLISKWRGSSLSEYYLFNEKTKALKPLFGQGENEWYSAQFGKNQNEIIVSTNKFGNFRRLYLFKNGKFKPITPKHDFDIDGFSVDHKREKILFEINNQGYTKVGALNTSDFKSLIVPNFKGKSIQHVFFGSTTRNGRFTTVGVSKSDSPRSSYIYDWKLKKLKKWVLSNSPEINTAAFVPPTLEYYKTRDNVSIPMFVYRPPACKKKTCPVIVSFHGGPESQSVPGFSPRTQLIIQEGFIYVTPNIRGSDGYGKKWLHSDNASKRLQVITDIPDAGEYIKKMWGNPKVGIMGGSYGGYATFMGMTKYAGTYDAGVAVVGMSNLVTFLQNTAPYRRVLRSSEYGDLKKDKDALIKLSPTSYLDNIKAPILIVHGANDPRVPAGEALQIYEVMEKKKLDGELILFSDEGHGVRKRKNKALYYGHVIEFFKKHLK